MTLALRTAPAGANDDGGTDMDVANNVLA